MHRPPRDSLLALLVGAAITTALYWLGGYLTLALVTGLCWTGGLKLTLHIGHRYPEFATGGTWTDKRWTGLGVGLVILAGLVGVSPTLHISNELRLGLGFLVMGAGFVAYPAGTLAVLERTEGISDPTPSASDTR